MKEIKNIGQHKFIKRKFIKKGCKFSKKTKNRFQYVFFGYYATFMQNKSTHLSLKSFESYCDIFEQEIHKNNFIKSFQNFIKYGHGDVKT